MLTYHTHFRDKTTEAQRDSVIELVKWQSQAMNPESNFRACGYLIYTAARIGVCVGGRKGEGRVLFQIRKLLLQFTFWPRAGKSLGPGARVKRLRHIGATMGPVTC